MEMCHVWFYLYSGFNIIYLVYLADKHKQKESKTFPIGKPFSDNGEKYEILDSDGGLYKTFEIIVLCITRDGSAFLGKLEIQVT